MKRLFAWFCVLCAAVLIMGCAGRSPDGDAGRNDISDVENGIRSEETTLPPESVESTASGASSESGETAMPAESTAPEETTRPSESTSSGGADGEEIHTIYFYLNGNRMAASLVGNSSTEALVDILKESDIVYTANDYGGFEKVGNIGHSLPRNDEYIDTSAGDVILYQGSSICLYYGNNSWSFTRIGRIDGYSASEIRDLLGAGNGAVQVRISLK